MNPQYILQQKKTRAIIPKVFSLLILSAIFYAGILFNLTLIELPTDTQETVKIAALLAVGFLLLLGIFLSVRRATWKHEFYADHIQYHKESIQYNEITEIIEKRNILDKIFKTYQLKLNKHTIKHISQPEMKNYIKQMVNFSYRSAGIQPSLKV